MIIIYLTKNGNGCIVKLRFEIFDFGVKSPK